MTNKVCKFARNIFMLVMAVMFMAVPYQAEASNFAERAANMSEVTGIRFSSSEDKVRIVVDATKEVTYETVVLSNPQRIVVNLYGAWLSPKVSKTISVDSRFAKQIRVAQFDTDTVRVVVESNVGKNNYDVFGLEGGNVPYRVVLDFGNLSPSSSGATIDFSGTTISKQKTQEEKDKEKSSGTKKDSEVKDPVNSDKDSSKKKDDTKTDDGKKDSSSDSKTVKQDIEDLKKPDPVVVEPTFTPGIAGKKICIDAGHGGSDVGAIGPTGVTEKSITLKVAKELEKLLTKEGAEVIMTRSGDNEVSSKKSAASDIEELQARCDVGNKAKADIFLSLHMDSYTNSTPNGTTGYYYSSGTKAGQRLSKYVSEGVIQELKTGNRGNKSCNFYVVKHTNMPATLLEIAFVSNDKEEKLMNSDAGVKKAANGILEGLKKFFG